MGKADRFSDMELEYIRAVYPQVGPTEIARKLGRSKSAVKARIKQMGLGGAQACNVDPEPRPNEGSEGAGQDTLGRLLELRGILRRQLADAPPNAVAAICREYRATMAEIERLERTDAAEDDNPFAAIAASISVDMRA